VQAPVISAMLEAHKEDHGTRLAQAKKTLQSPISTNNSWV
jgi:hypothetical protein